MRLLIASLFVILSLQGFSQKQIGHFSAFQVVEKEVQTGDLILYYPKNLSRKAGVLYLTLELNVGLSNSILEITKDNRQKMIEMLDAYQSMVKVLEIPKKLPASIEVGQIKARTAFFNDGKLHMDDQQTVYFYIKVDKNGGMTLAMAIGELVSKSNPNLKHMVPLLWFDGEKVEDFEKVISNDNIARFMRNKDKVLSPEALDILGEE
ncbi:MAG: hypothetical protein ACPGD5_03175 [Salibacteraceae bacterium]